METPTGFTIVSVAYEAYVVNFLLSLSDPCVKQQANTRLDLQQPQRLLKSRLGDLGPTQRERMDDGIEPVISLFNPKIMTDAPT